MMMLARHENLVAGRQSRVHVLGTDLGEDRADVQAVLGVRGPGGEAVADFGKSRGEGTVPGTWCSRPEPDSIERTAPSRPRVYSWVGCVSSSFVGACSMT